LGGGCDDLALGIEPHDLHAYRTGSPTFDLMFVSEEVDSSFASSVVKAALDQHSQHSGFTSVDYNVLVYDFYSCRF
jgi:hypothetical protein